MTPRGPPAGPPAILTRLVPRQTPPAHREHPQLHLELSHLIGHSASAAQDTISYTGRRRTVSVRTVPAEAGAAILRSVARQPVRRSRLRRAAEAGGGRGASKSRRFSARRRARSYSPGPGRKPVSRPSAAQFLADPRARPGATPRVISQVTQHPAVAGLQRWHGTEVTRPLVEVSGLASLQAVAGALARRRHGTAPPAVVSVMLASNETGAIQPVTQIAAGRARARWCAHVDTAQAAGKTGINVTVLGRTPPADPARAWCCRRSGSRFGYCPRSSTPRSGFLIRRIQPTGD